MPHPDPAPSVSVIVPVLDEAAHLALIARTPSLRDPRVEFIIVDGGSRDASVELARQSGAHVVKSPIRGRAAQMNLGAAEARGDVLLFLHADTLLPCGWPDAVMQALARSPDVVGGSFRRRFTGSSRVLSITAWLSDWRVRWTKLSFGDQSQFVCAEVFRRVGGFSVGDPLEDVDFALRVRRLGRIVLLPLVVLSSDRRFHRRGAVWQTWGDALTLFHWWLMRRSRANRRE